MSLLAMPMLVINMGAECLFVLIQRLEAQKIAWDKSCRVMLDISSAMFNRAYMEALFEPQETCTMPTMRLLFEHMIHCTIMRLGDNSMEKLFELMAMGFKYQLVCSSSLDAMLQVTYTHLAQLKALLAPVPRSEHCMGLLDYVEQRVRDTYGLMSVGALHLLRQTLMRFFHNRRVKVSLFLQEGIQTPSGRMVLHSPVAPGLGDVTLYGPQPGAQRTEKLKLAVMEVDPVEFFIHPAPLGTNMYWARRQKAALPARKPEDLLVLPTAVGSPDSSSQAAGRHAVDNKMMYAEEVLRAQPAGAAGSRSRHELGLLATLMAIRPQDEHAEQGDGFKLQLFADDDSMGSQAIGTGVTVLRLGQVAALQFDDQQASYKAGMVAALKLDDDVAPHPSAGGIKAEEEDLLDLIS